MNKFYSMLGMAKKSNNIIIGYDSVEKFIKSNTECLVIIAENASEKTKKNVKFLCNKYNTKFIEKGNKELIGKMLGKKFVSTVAVYEKNIISYLVKI